MIANINPNAKSPLYQGAMRLKQVQNGVQFIALDVHRGNFTLMTLGSEWEARVIPIISGYDKRPLSSIIRLQAEDINHNIVDLCDNGFHPHVEAAEPWAPSRIPILAERDDILTFYPWLIKEGFTRAAKEIEDTFFDFFIDVETFWHQLLER